MFRKISALLATFVLSLGISAGSAVAASATDDRPVSPVVNFVQATVAGETDQLTVTWPADVADKDSYRYLVFAQGKYVMQLNKALRGQLHTTGIDLAELQQKYGQALDAYAQSLGKTRYELDLQVRPFYYDQKKQYPNLPKERHVPTVNGFGGNPVSFIPLGDSPVFKLTDPATLPAPKLTDRPEAVDFVLGTAACVAGQPQVDEFLIRINGDLQPNHRIVATVDGKSISLKAELREKLNTDKQLTVADFKAAYPAFDFTPFQGKTVTVQSYFFDRERAYDPALYATGLEPLVPGTKLDRYIALGEAKSVVFDTAENLPCAGSQLIKDAPEAVDFVLGTAACVAGQPQVDEFLIRINGDLQPNHRIVATVDGKSISLKAELREKLNTDKQLTVADFKAAYPAFDFTPFQGKTVTVQSYFFDRERAYDPALYATGLEPLVPGTKLDRYIALGEAKSVVFNPEAKPECTPDNGQNVVPVQPEKPAAEAAPVAKKTLAKTGTSLSGAVLLSGLGVLAGATMLTLRRKK